MSVVRMTRALSSLFPCANAPVVGAGARGISNVSRERRFKGLRIASSAPPALSFSSVQSSRNSFPCPFVPRMNTGIASGIRGHRLSSLVRVPFGRRASLMGHARRTASSIDHGPGARGI